MPSMSTNPSTREDFGLPPPSTALWSYLLKSDKPSPSEKPSPGPLLPPTTPLDRNSTSMRILLHDTQANFEAFSTQVVQLISNVNEAKQELKLTKSLFEREHETLSSNMIDLANRCQTQIQKSLGKPSQAPELEQLRKDVDHRLEILDHRLDAIQMFNQTHSHALQTQMQMLQSLQDQQSTILTAVVPLLPLLQAIPVHIESAQKNSLGSLEKISASVAAACARPTWNPPRSSILPRKRPHSPPTSENRSSSPHSGNTPLTSGNTPLTKKIRPSLRSTSAKSANAPTPDLKMSLAQSSSPLAPTSFNGNQPPPTNSHHLRAPSFSTINQPLYLASSARKPSLLPPTATPRRPLADISLTVLTPARTPSLSLSRQSTLAASTPWATKDPHSALAGLASASEKPSLRTLRVYASLPRRISAKAQPEPYPGAKDGNTEINAIAAAASRTVPRLPESNPPRPQATTNPTPQAQGPLAPRLSPIVSRILAPLHLQQRGTARVEATGRSKSDTNGTDTGIPDPAESSFASRGQTSASNHAPHAPNPPSRAAVNPSPHIQPVTKTIPWPETTHQHEMPPPVDVRTRAATLGLKTTPASMSLGQRNRERKSPFREAGRRFIPFVDSDDEDDDEEDGGGFGEMLTTLTR